VEVDVLLSSIRIDIETQEEGLDGYARKGRGETRGQLRVQRCLSCGEQQVSMGLLPRIETEGLLSNQTSGLSSGQGVAMNDTSRMNPTIQELSSLLQPFQSAKRSVRKGLEEKEDRNLQSGG
jgi:hypothetical protein